MAREAGLPSLSVLSVIAGTVTAYGTFAIVAAVAGAILVRADATTDFSTNDWTSTTALSGLVTALVLLVAYVFGGYVAGRMAARAGVIHGAAVALFSLVAGAGVGAAVGALSDRADIESNLGSIGVPTSFDDWTAVSWATVAASLAAVVVGAVLGGALGVRWHTTLIRRVADPDVGASADARHRAEQLEAERDRYVGAAAATAPTTTRGRWKHEQREREERLDTGEPGDHDAPRSTTDDGPHLVDLRDGAEPDDESATDAERERKLRMEQIREAGRSAVVVPEPSGDSGRPTDR